MKTEQELRDVFDRPFDGDGDPRIQVARVLTRAEAQAVLEHRGDLISDLAEPALLSRTEQAEARVKELEEEIERRAAQEEMDDALRDGCMDSLLAAESSLKERDEEVARLREALDEIATHPGPHADEAAHWRADTARSALSHQGGKA